jgi:serine/threonine-protein kinase
MSDAVDRAAAYRLFSAALELPAGRRDAFLAEHCGGMPGLEHKVRALLALAEADDATGLLLAAPGPPVPDRIGREYGRFRLLALLGIGGMGAVYRAERTDGVPQTVAVKVLRDSISAAHSSQFAREARILAGLEHPSIARLIDVGVREGEGWLAMEFVAGQPITDYCDARGLDLRERVRLLVAVADAVATAHRRLIVHRDIKPSNVLVGEDGRPKLIDFGIAYVLREADAVREATTDVSRLFTPHYAAPEQVRGEPVTVATDVFGLGALAYRVLSGCEPFAEATSAVGYLLAVTQQDIAPASEAGRASGIEPARVRALQGDLDSILQKALDRDPARRYVGVEDLQGDLEAYLDGRPIRARASTWAYRAGKFARRHAWGVSVASLALLGLGVAAVVYGLQERRVTQALEASARRGAFLESMLKSADPHSGRRDITVAELVDSAERSLDQGLGKEPLVEASMLGLIADTDGSLGRYTQGLAASDRQLALLQANGAQDIELARALLIRGELFRGYGHYADGVQALRRAVALLQPLAHVEADKANALGELGTVLANSGTGTGAEAEAEAMLRQSIDIRSRLGKDQQVDSMQSLNNLAALLSHEGRYRESAELAAQALALGRRYLPPDYPDLLTTLQTYAMALVSVGEEAGAEPALRDIVARSARVRGPDHPDTLAAQVQLGEVLTDLGRYAEAGQVLNAAAVNLDRVQGPEAPYSTGAWSDFALAACSGEEAAKGLAAAERIDAIRARTLAATDWHRFAAQSDIGYCLERERRYEQAEPILLRSAAALEASRGAQFFTTQMTYKALRELYQKTGRPALAARYALKIAH